jgi:hypothetical protein
MYPTVALPGMWPPTSTGCLQEKHSTAASIGTQSPVVSEAGGLATRSQVVLGNQENPAFYPIIAREGEKPDMIWKYKVLVTCPPKTDPQVKLERWIEGRQRD